MTEETKKLFDAPWTVTREEIRKDTLRYGVAKANIDIDLVAIDLAHEDAHRLARLPELYDALLAHLSATCIRCKSRNCKFDKESFIQNEGCGGCEGIFREQWKLLKKVRDGE